MEYGISTPEAVWKAVKCDENFASRPVEMQIAMQPFLLAMPELLARDGLLNQPATLENLMLARHLILRFCEHNNYAEVIAKAAPEAEVEKYGSREVYAEVIHGRLISCLDVVTRFLNRVPLPTKAPVPTVTDSQVMLDPTIGLNPLARDLYENGYLSINRLLLIQPMVVFATE